MSARKLNFKKMLNGDASKKNAEIIRNALENILAHDENIELDFTNCQINPFLAGEVFAALAKSMGEEEFWKRILFNNIDERNAGLIKVAIRDRNVDSRYFG